MFTFIHLVTFVLQFILNVQRNLFKIICSSTVSQVNIFILNKFNNKQNQSISNQSIATKTNGFLNKEIGNRENYLFVEFIGLLTSFLCFNLIFTIELTPLYVSIGDRNASNSCNLNPATPNDRLPAPDLIRRKCRLNFHRIEYNLQFIS